LQQGILFIMSTVTYSEHHSDYLRPRASPQHFAYTRVSDSCFRLAR